MLISFCIPVHNRTYDLKKVMPYLLEAINYSTPGEIVVIDYNSPDDLPRYMKGIIENSTLQDGNCITYRRYTGRDYYHMAHARNLSVLASSGEYFVISSADIYFSKNFLAYVRLRLEGDGFTWLYDEKYKGVIVCKRQEFIDAGGYDERYEYYGPEDKDLHGRLVRRGRKYAMINKGMVHVISTPDDEKIKNYRLPLSKHDMHKLGKAVLEENDGKQALVVNEEGWGAW